MTEPASIYIACPIYGDPSAPFFETMLRIVTAKTRHRIVFQPQYDVAMVHRSRDVLASLFLAQGDCEWLLMTDSDMQFAMEDIERLLGRGKHLIGGLYHKRFKTPAPEYVLNALPGRSFDPADGEVQEVRYTGTGFMLIHRSVLERMRAAYPEIEYFPDANEAGGPRWNFFWSGIRDKRFLSGDWGFCQRWLDMGEKVYVDCGRKLPHHGRGVY